MKPFFTLLILFSLFCVKSFSQTNTLAADTTVAGSADNFPGGKTAYENYIGTNGKFPAIALKYNVTGIVLVKFVIEPDGNLSHLQIYTGIGSGSEEEVMRLFKNSGKWTPNTLNGVPVKTRCLVPVRFLIDEYSDKPKGVVSGEAGSWGAKDIAAFIRLESFGTPVADAGEYLNRTIGFFGKIYDQKISSDTELILSCSELRYGGSSMRYTPVILRGEKAQIKSKKPQTNKYIKGTGKVVSYNGGIAILIDDSSHYIIKDNPDF